LTARTCAFERGLAWERLTREDKEALLAASGLDLDELSEKELEDVYAAVYKAVRLLLPASCALCPPALPAQHNYCCVHIGAPPSPAPLPRCALAVPARL
jgi:hypothetical protein